MRVFHRDVLDGYPATFARLGAVGDTARARSESSMSAKTGAIQDLFRHYGIDSEAIVAAAQGGCSCKLL
jgi:pyruvate dehydrogenase E1 component